MGGVVDAHLDIPRPTPSETEPKFGGCTRPEEAVTSKTTQRAGHSGRRSDGDPIPARREVNSATYNIRGTEVERQTNVTLVDISLAETYDIHLILTLCKGIRNCRFQLHRKGDICPYID